jgi:hypothetical protein
MYELRVLNQVLEMKVHKSNHNNNNDVNRECNLPHLGTKKRGNLSFEPGFGVVKK